MKLGDIVHPTKRKLSSDSVDSSVNNDIAYSTSNNGGNNSHAADQSHRNNFTRTHGTHSDSSNLPPSSRGHCAGLGHTNKKSISNSNNSNDDSDEASVGGGVGCSAGHAQRFNAQVLSKYFHLKISDAAKELGMSVSMLKKYCRSFGIKRWPFRKLQSVERQILDAEKDLSQFRSKDIENIAQGEDPFTLSNHDKEQYASFFKALERLKKLQQDKDNIVNNVQMDQDSTTAGRGMISSSSSNNKDFMARSDSGDPATILIVTSTTTTTMYPPGTGSREARQHHHHHHHYQGQRQHQQLLHDHYDGLNTYQSDHYRQHQQFVKSATPSNSAAIFGYGSDNHKPAARDTPSRKSNSSNSTTKSSDTGETNNGFIINQLPQGHAYEPSSVQQGREKKARHGLTFIDYGGGSFPQYEDSYWNPNPNPNATPTTTPTTWSSLRSPSTYQPSGPSFGGMTGLEAPNNNTPAGRTSMGFHPTPYSSNQGSNHADDRMMHTGELALNRATHSNQFLQQQQQLLRPFPMQQGHYNPPPFAPLHLPPEDSSSLPSLKEFMNNLNQLELPPPGSSRQGTTNNISNNNNYPNNKYLN